MRRVMFGVVAVLAFGCGVQEEGVEVADPTHSKEADPRLQGVSCPIGCGQGCPEDTICCNWSSCGPSCVTLEACNEGSCLTCEDVPSSCGLIYNGCNALIECSCGAGKVCVNNRCLAPKTCADYPGQCGTLSDGVGGTITCGCAAGYFCSNNMCARESCTCAGCELDDLDLCTGSPSVITNSCAPGRVPACRCRTNAKGACISTCGCG